MMQLLLQMSGRACSRGHKLTIAAICILWVLGGVFQVAAAQGLTPSTTTKTWTSPNGQHAVRYVQTITVSAGSGRGGPIAFPSATTVVTGIGISPDGVKSEQWQWPSDQKFREYTVAGALVANSGRLFVLVSHDHGNMTGDTSHAAVVILDEKGQMHATVSAAAWWNALGPAGAASLEQPPELRFLDNDKLVEIKLASGKVAHVNTDTGELTVEKAAATAPATVATPATAATVPAGSNPK